MYKVTFIKNDKAIIERYFENDQSSLLKYLNRFNIKPNLGQRIQRLKTGKFNEIDVVISSYADHSSMLPSVWTPEFLMLEVFPDDYYEIEQKYNEFVEELSATGEMYLERIADVNSILSMQQYDIVGFFKFRDLKPDEVSKSCTRLFNIGDKSYVFGFELITKG